MRLMPRCRLFSLSENSWLIRNSILPFLDSAYWYVCPREHPTERRRSRCSLRQISISLRTATSIWRRREPAGHFARFVTSPAILANR